MAAAQRASLGSVRVRTRPRVGFWGIGNVWKRCEDTSHSKSPALADEKDLHYDVSTGPLSIIRNQIKNSKKKC